MGSEDSNWPQSWDPPRQGSVCPGPRGPTGRPGEPTASRSSFTGRWPSCVSLWGRGAQVISGGGDTPNPRGLPQLGPLARFPTPRAPCVHQTCAGLLALGRGLGSETIRVWLAFLSAMPMSRLLHEPLDHPAGGRMAASYGEDLVGAGRGWKGGRHLPGVSPVPAEQDVASVLGAPAPALPWAPRTELSFLGTKRRGQTCPEPAQATFRSEGSTARCPESRLACRDLVARRGAASEGVCVLRPLLCFCGMPLGPPPAGTSDGQGCGGWGHEA